MKRLIITSKQLNEMVSLENYDSKKLKKIQHAIYKTVAPFCGKMHKDEAWQNVRTLIEIIEGVEGVEDVIVGAGQYSNFLNPEKGAYRDYETTVVTPFGKLYGYIRCNAAGTMDDIFKMYDLTISLYPDKRKDADETGLNEENNINVGIATTASTIPSMVNAVTQNKPDITQASNMGDPVIHISNPNSQNGSNDNALTQHVEVEKGDTIERAMQNQLNPTATGAGGDVEISGDGISEQKTYTKKQIEKARISKMKNEGRTMTKKELRESFK